MPDHLGAFGASVTTIPVGLGEIHVAKGEGHLVAYGLGSCIGVCGYDAKVRVGGMAHVMLPESGRGSNGELPGRYASDGVDNLIAALVERGAEASRLEFVLGGGAQMLVAPGISDRFNIGARNEAMVTRILRQKGMPIRGKRTGGQSGRTLTLDVATGKVTVKAVGDKELVTI